MDNKFIEYKLLIIKYRKDNLLNIKKLYILLKLKKLFLRLK
jgi:hypothetical protein